MTEPKRVERTIAIAWAIARNPTADAKELLRGAEIFTARALPDESDRLIERARKTLEGSGVESGGFLTRLAAVNRTLRDAGIPKRVSDVGPLARRLEGEGDFILVEAPGSRMLLVVLSTMFNDFWVSLPVLHCYLAAHNCSVLYLKDPSNRMFLHGVAGAGPGFAALEAAVLRTAEQLGVADRRIMGFSSGGYAGLLLASRIRANAYLGFSIRTDLNPDSTLPLDRLASRIGAADDIPEILLDLRQVVAEAGSPGRGVLYYGEAAIIDAAHAERMRGLPGFILKPLKGGLHNSVMTLLAQNEFSRTLKTFLS